MHPVQWLTSNFLHSGIAHLAGNLIFLWAFALVVEGKVGAFPFLLIFVGIGVSQSALEQLVTLGTDLEPSMGNSAIVYGIMAIALVWAPKNELNCAWILGFRGGLIDISIFWVALLYIVLEVFEVVFWGAALGQSVVTAVLHLSGAAVGFVVGSAMVKMGWVDCEGWDLYSVFGNGQGQGKVKVKKRRRKTSRSTTSETPPRIERPKSAKTSSGSSGDDRAESATRRFRGLLESGSVEEVVAAYDRSMRTIPGWTPTDADWVALIQAVLNTSDWRQAVSIMETYLKRASNPSSRVRLKLAQVLVKELQRPSHGLSVLDELPEGSLPPNLDDAARQLRIQAQEMIDEGVLELDGDRW